MFRRSFPGASPAGERKHVVRNASVSPSSGHICGASVIYGNTVTMVGIGSVFVVFFVVFEKNLKTF